jgi:hypothetical protein
MTSAHVHRAHAEKWEAFRARFVSPKTNQQYEQRRGNANSGPPGPLVAASGVSTALIKLAERERVLLAELARVSEERADLGKQELKRRQAELKQWQKALGRG